MNQGYREKSAAYYAIAAPWVNPILHRVVMAGDRFTTFSVYPASDREDLEFATDYTVMVTGRAAVAFRGRDCANATRFGKPVRQMTLRRAGQRTEESKVMSGHGDFYVTVWCSDGTLEAGAVVDLERFRTLPWYRRSRMAETAFSTVPFVGYDVAALIAADTVVASWPSPDYFAAVADRTPDGQERLW